jgi:hypothetical protein
MRQGGSTICRYREAGRSSGEVTPGILVTRLMGGNGITRDFKRNRMFLTDLAGDLYSSRCKLYYGCFQRLGTGWDNSVAHQYLARN